MYKHDTINLIRIVIQLFHHYRLLIEIRLKILWPVIVFEGKLLR
jgi:hypothetical protein